MESFSSLSVLEIILFCVGFGSIFFGFLFCGICHQRCKKFLKISEDLTDKGPDGDGHEWQILCVQAEQDVEMYLGRACCCLLLSMTVGVVLIGLVIGIF